MFCTGCGKEILPNLQNCPNCGRSVTYTANRIDTLLANSKKKKQTVGMKKVIVILSVLWVMTIIGGMTLAYFHLKSDKVMAADIALYHNNLDTLYLALVLENKANVADAEADGMLNWLDARTADSPTIDITKYMATYKQYRDEAYNDRQQAIKYRELATK
jgi:uncharacterized membrane protein YvbJ